MEIRICTDDDIISLLECASDDKEVYKLEMFDDWAQYQRWILDAIYNKNFQVLVAVDDIYVIGFLIWNMSKVYYKWLAYLDYVYVSKELRKGEAADKLVIEFIHNCYNSSAQRLKFDSRVLPSKWVEVISSNAPLSEYTTYYTTRTDELKGWYNRSIKPLKES